MVQIKGLKQETNKLKYEIRVHIWNSRERERENKQYTPKCKSSMENQQVIHLQVMPFSWSVTLQVASFHIVFYMYRVFIQIASSMILHELVWIKKSTTLRVGALDHKWYWTSCAWRLKFKFWYWSSHSWMMITNSIIHDSTCSRCAWS